jgi:phosphate transport system permease protein
MTGAQIAAAARRQTSVIPRRSAKETTLDRGFGLLMYLALGLAFLGLGAIIYDFAKDGLRIVSWEFVTSFPSRVIPERAGIESAVIGTIYLMILCALFVVPLGVMTAVYLEEYADPDRWYNRLIEVNIQNLAAVPSVVYGILGLAFIVRGPLSLGRTLLAGGITLSLLVLPVVIIVAREAIRSAARPRSTTGSSSSVSVIVVASAVSASSRAAGSEWIRIRPQACSASNTALGSWPRRMARVSSA